MLTKNQMSTWTFVSPHGSARARCVDLRRRSSSLRSSWASPFSLWAQKQLRRQFSIWGRGSDAGASVVSCLGETATRLARIERGGGTRSKEVHV
jgi:hypothetical protein